MKEFFKLTSRKTIWFLIIFFLGGLIGSASGDAFRYGFPFGFFTKFTLPCPSGGGCGKSWDFNFINLILSIVSVYLITCVLVHFLKRRPDIQKKL